MILGCACLVEQGYLLKNSGFDYIEFPLVPLLGSSLGFEIANAAVESTPQGLPLLVANMFLPNQLSVVGSDVQWSKVTQYAQSAMAFVHSVGAGKVIIGSGQSRKIPAEFPIQEAKQQLRRFLALLADLADPLNITICLEPLNQHETNFVNTLAEAVDVARDVGSSRVGVIADLYHMQIEGDRFESLIDHYAWITHVHIADTNRLAPGTGAFPIADFLQCLHSVGYSGMVTVECRWRNIAQESHSTVRFLRGLGF